MNRSERIIGLDFARGIAVWGMLLMNFKIVMTSESRGFLASVAHFMEGHYGVMFVVLAGVGISLFTKKAILSGDIKLLNLKRKILLKRSFFLMVVGLLFSLVWPADILHYYGVYITIGALVVHLSNKRLILLTVAVTFLFPILFMFLSYESGWDWSTLSYTDFWTVKGFIRNTFFNGFHPVIPWVAFLFIGIVFGRVKFDRGNLIKWLLVSTVIALTTELLAFKLIENSSEPLTFFFSRDAMPPSPLFVIASASEAIIMIIISVFISDLLKRSFIIRPIVYTGQMVLSHYISHVFIGMGFLELIGRLTAQSLEFSLLFSSIYFIFAVVFSYLWNKRFSRGPMELLMRRISG